MTEESFGQAAGSYQHIHPNEAIFKIVKALEGINESLSSIEDMMDTCYSSVNDIKDSERLSATTFLRNFRQIDRQKEEEENGGDEPEE